MNRQIWEFPGREQEPSWYLDPITARQKRETHLGLIRKWSEGFRVQRILKTDLFEEAYGSDSLLDSMFSEAELACGMDAAFSTAGRALQRHGQKIQAFVCDVRNLAVRNASVDMIVSTSTPAADHSAASCTSVASGLETIRVSMMRISASGKS